MALKKLHKYKLNDTHSVIVYDNNSKSNYNRFVTIVENSHPTVALWGTTAKSTDTKKQYLEQGNYGLTLYNKQNN